MAYRHFIADSSRIVTENTAHALSSGGGIYMNVRLHDILNPVPKDDRTTEEIVTSLRKKL